LGKVEGITNHDSFPIVALLIYVKDSNKGLIKENEGKSYGGRVFKRQV
jgi:hypothetical protein